MQRLLLINATTTEIQCGKPLTRTISVPDGCGKTTTNGDKNDKNAECLRRYILYLPSTACSTNSYKDGNANSNDDKQVDILPLVFAVHCLGCTPQTMMHWTDMAETYDFVLVIPQGLQKSFHAPSSTCCGYALQNQVDDVRFFQRIIQQLSSSSSSDDDDDTQGLLSPLTSTPAILQVSSNVVYAMGWSNGGYMVVAASKLFRAIAPISGYHVPDFDKNPNNHPPVSLFMHHAQDDPFVRITGCCTDPTMPACCCSLSSYDGPEQCVSADAMMNKFALRNGCSLEDPVVSVTLDRNDSADTTTTTTTTCTSLVGCTHDTTFCKHVTGAHFNRPSFRTAFPMTNHIAQFFARHACQVASGGNGVWNDETRTCQCSLSSTTTSATTHGRYCLIADTIRPKLANESDTNVDPFAPPSSDIHKSHPLFVDYDATSQRMQKQGNRGFAACLLLLFVGMSGFVAYRTRTTIARRMTRPSRTGFQKVSTVEMSTV